jgi:hypothetical protein
MPGNHIGKRTRSKNRIPGIDYPSFEQPLDLFRAIVNGKPKDSWIEIDYNEVGQYPLLKGRVKDVFAEAARLSREHIGRSGDTGNI